MSILDSALFNDLFGPTRHEAVPPSGNQPVKEEQETLSPIKKNEHMNIFSYRPEVLKYKLSSFIKRLTKAGLTYRVRDSRVEIFRNKSKLEELEPLMQILHCEPDIEAMLILRVATMDKNLAGCIEERASIRWAEGLSDSLFLAVLCNIRPTGETPSKELQPRTEWEEELKQLGFCTWPETQ